MKFINFLYFSGYFLPSWTQIRILIAILSRIQSSEDWSVFIILIKAILKLMSSEILVDLAKRNFISYVSIKQCYGSGMKVQPDPDPTLKLGSKLKLFSVHRKSAARLFNILDFL
jgi:hypothetical protein